MKNASIAWTGAGVARLSILLLILPVAAPVASGQTTTGTDCGLVLYQTRGDIENRVIAVRNILTGREWIIHRFRDRDRSYGAHGVDFKLTPDCKHVYLRVWSKRDLTFRKINFSNGKVVRTINLPSSFDVADVSKDEKTILLSSKGSNVYSLFDVAKNRVVALPHDGKLPSSCGFDNSGLVVCTKFYVYAPCPNPPDYSTRPGGLLGLNLPLHPGVWLNYGDGTCAIHSLTPKVVTYDSISATFIESWTAGHDVALDPIEGIYGSLRPRSFVSLATRVNASNVREQASFACSHDLRTCRPLQTGIGFGIVDRFFADATVAGLVLYSGYSSGTRNIFVGEEGKSPAVMRDFPSGTWAYLMDWV